MVEASFLALATPPSMTASAAELTLPASAAVDWASAGAATPSWNRTAALAAVEASNALRTRMAFPSALELVEFGRVAGRAGKAVTFLGKPRPAHRLLQGGSGVGKTRVGPAVFMLFPDAVQREALAERCTAEPGPFQTLAFGTIPAFALGHAHISPGKSSP